MVAVALLLIRDFRSFDRIECWRNSLLRTVGIVRVALHSSFGNKGREMLSREPVIENSFILLLSLNLPSLNHGVNMQHETYPVVTTFIRLTKIVIPRVKIHFRHAKTSILDMRIDIPGVKTFVHNVKVSVP